MATRDVYTSASPGPITGNAYMDQIAAHLGVIYDKIQLPVTSPAGTNNYTGTIDPAFSAGLVAGMGFTIVWPNTNTGASTLNLNSVGAVALVDRDGSALSGGELVAGTRDLVIYDGTNFIVLSIIPDASPAEMTAGVVGKYPDASTVKGYVRGTVLYSGNGYAILPNDLIIQWGRVSVPGNSETADISFPIAFPNALFMNMGATENLNTLAVDEDGGCVTRGSTTVFRCRNASPTTNVIAWWAIGY